MIILDRGESLVRDLDLTASHDVGLTFLNDVIEFARTVVEERGLNHFSTFVHEVQVKQAALSSPVGPVSQLILLDDFDLDDPVMRVRVQAIDWHVDKLILVLRLLFVIKKVGELVDALLLHIGC